MRNRADHLSDSFLLPPEPEPKSEYSILLIVAGRMQGESLRYQLVSRGFDVDLARSLTFAMERLSSAAYDAIILDWQTLEVEYRGPNRAETWFKLAREARSVAKPVGLVALFDSEELAPAEIEQVGAVRISRGAA